VSISDERILSKSAIFFTTLYRVNRYDFQKVEETTYQVGAMTNAINLVAFLHIRSALIADLFDDSGNVASEYPSDAAHTLGGSVVNIGGVNGYCDSSDFDVVWSHGLLLDVCESGIATFLNDDRLHFVYVVMGDD
jgi:hypothetical protein